MVSRSALSLSVSLLAIVSVLYISPANAQSSATPVNACAQGEVLVSGSTDSVLCATGFKADTLGHVSINGSGVAVSGPGAAQQIEALEVRGSIAFGNGPTVSPFTHSAALVGRGKTSNFNLDLQDGTGRVNYLWNATDGYDIWTHQNAGNYLVSNEPASNFKQTINPAGNPGALFAFFSSSGGEAGAPIAWSEIAHFSGANHIWLSPRGEASDFLISTAGNVGIGTVAPQAKLDVEGTVNAKAYTLNGQAFPVPPVCLGENMLQFNGVKFLCTPVIR